MNKKQGAVIAAVVAGLVMGGNLIATTASAKIAKVKCMGANSCKGKGMCKSANNECKGHNECKGKGVMMTTEKRCTAKGGSVVPEETKPKS